MVRGEEPGLRKWGGGRKDSLLMPRRGGRRRLEIRGAQGKNRERVLGDNVWEEVKAEGNEEK